MKSNYRVLAHQYGEQVCFEIYEVFYEEKKVHEAHKINSLDVSGDNVKEIRRKLKQMKKATKKPVLWAGNKFPEEY